MFKNIFKLAKLIIFQPAKAWKMIDENGYKSNIHNTYVFPLIFTGVAASVVGYLWVNAADLQMIVKISAIGFLASYVGFCLSVFSVKIFLDHFLDHEVGWSKALYFTAYSFTLIFVVNIIVGLLPHDAFFLKALNLYTFFIVAQGSFVLGVSEDRQRNFVLVVTAIILLCPAIVDKIFSLMM